MAKKTSLPKENKLPIVKLSAMEAKVKAYDIVLEMMGSLVESEDFAHGLGKANKTKIRKQLIALGDKLETQKGRIQEKVDSSKED